MANTGGIRAGKAFVELYADEKKFLKVMNTAGAKLKTWGNNIAGIGTKIAAAGSLAASTLAASMKVFTSQGDTMAKMSQRTGIAVESLSQLGYAAAQSGADISQLEQGIRHLQKQGGDASVEGLMKIADELASIEDPSKKAARAMELFGKSGTMLIPMMADGGKGMADLMKRADALGLTMDGRAANAAVVFGDNLADVWAQVKKVAFEIGAALAPALEEHVAGLQQSLTGTIKWVKENQAVIVTALKVAAGVSAAGVALVAVGKIIAGLGSTITIASTALRGMAVLFAALTPAGAVLAGIAIAATAIAAATALASANTETLVQMTQRLADAGDKARTVDQLRAERLTQLSKKTALTTAEQNEAMDLIGKLDKGYGSMGASVDTATGKIIGMAKATERLNTAMAEAATTDLKNQLDAISKEQGGIDEFLSKESPQRFGLAGSLLKGADADGREQAAARRVELEKQAESLRARLSELGVGNKDAITGSPPPGAKGPGVDAADSEEMAGMVKRLEQLRKQASERHQTDLEREVAGIEKLRDETLALIDTMRKAEAAKPNGGNAERLGDLAAAVANTSARAALDILTAQDVSAQQLADEQTNIAKQAMQERADFEKTLNDDILRAKIDGIADEETRRHELLEMEKRAMLDQAREMGVDPALVDRLFQFKQIAAGTQDAMKSFATSGSFDGRAATALGRAGSAEINGTAEDLLETTKKQAQAIERMKQLIEDHALEGRFA